LLIKRGYGGSRADAAEAIGKSGDEGLDGITKEDRLGLDIIYVQAKRWAATVGRPEIQKFARALHGQHATKGIFITTSDFSRDANDYVSKIGSKIVLIDGSRLAELMIEFGVAVATDATYTMKRIDNDSTNSFRLRPRCSRPTEENVALSAMRSHLILSLKGCVDLSFHMELLAHQFRLWPCEMTSNRNLG
jgi:predicted helicase